MVEDTRGIAGAGRDLVSMVALDEGFDRPFWKVMQSAFGAVPTRLVPHRLETILEDGILFALAQNKKLPKSESWKGSRKSWDRLTVKKFETQPYGSFVLSELSNEIRRGLQITVIIKSGSSIARSGSLKALSRVKVRIFNESEF